MCNGNVALKKRDGLANNSTVLDLMLLAAESHCVALSGVYGPVNYEN